MTGLALSGWDILQDARTQIGAYAGDDDLGREDFLVGIPMVTMPAGSA